MEEDAWGMIGESKEDAILLSDEPIRINESIKGYVEVEIETINSSLKLPRWQQKNAAIQNCSLDSKRHCLGGGVDDLNDVLSLLAVRPNPNFTSRKGDLVKIHFSLSTTNDEIRNKEYEIYISVEASNDPTFITVDPGIIQVPEGNTAVAIKGIKISDADCVDESDYLEVTLETQLGQLEIKGDEVVRYWVHGYRNRNYQKLVFRSNLNEINGLLKESLYYVPKENKVGDDLVTVIVEDLTSNEKTQMVEETLSVLVYPDCSLPSLQVPSMITLNEDSAATFNASISPSSCELDFHLNITTSSGKISLVSSDEIEVTNIHTNGFSGSGRNKAWNLALQKIVYTSDSNYYTIGRDLVSIKFEIGIKNQNGDYETARRETLVQIKSVPDPHILSLLSSSNKSLETNEDQHLQFSLLMNDPDILHTTDEGFIYKVSITSEQKAQFVLGSYHGVIFLQDNDRRKFMADYNSVVDCLKNITYIPSKDFHGHDIIRISVTDSDGDFEDTVEIPVSVIPVFDEPSIHVPQKFECSFAKVCELAGISFNNPDGNGSFKLRMNTNHGRLSSFHGRSLDWYDSVGSAFELNETLSNLVYFRSPDIRRKHYDTISISVLNENDNLVTSTSTLVFVEEMMIADISSFIRYKKLSYHSDEHCYSSFRSTNESVVTCHDLDEGVPSLYCIQYETCDFNYFETDTVDETETDYELRLSVSDGFLDCETLGVIELERTDTSIVLRGKAFNLNSVLSSLTYISHSGSNDIFSLSLLRNETFALSKLNVPIQVTEVDDNLWLKSSRELFFTEEDTIVRMDGIKVEYDGKFMVKAHLDSYNGEFKLIESTSNEDWSSSHVLCEYPRDLNKLLGSVSFRPDRDWNSEETGDYAELKIRVKKASACSDDEGLQDFTLYESVLELPIHVLPLNDYPLIEFQNQIPRDDDIIVVPEDIALAIPMQVSDVDDDVLSVSITSPNGTVALYTGHGNHTYSYFTEGRGDGSFYKEIVLGGRKEAINEYLAHLQFRGDENFHGKTALTIVVQDSRSGYDSKETMITVQPVADLLRIWSVVDSTLKQPIPTFHPGDRRIIARDWIVTSHLYSEMSVSEKKKELRPLTIPRPFTVSKERLEGVQRICTKLHTSHGGLSIPKHILENIEMKSEQRKELSFVGDLEEINTVFANIIYDVTLQDVELIELKEIWDILGITVSTENCENKICSCSFDKLSASPTHHQFKILIRKNL